ncbi:MAG: integrase [Methermicoccaceae archaeon]
MSPATVDAYISAIRRALLGETTPPQKHSANAKPYRCKKCGNLFYSGAKEPECSRCWSTNLEQLKEMPKAKPAPAEGINDDVSFEEWLIEHENERGRPHDKLLRGLKNFFNFLIQKKIPAPEGQDWRDWYSRITIPSSNMVDVDISVDDVVRGYKATPDELKPLFKLLAYSGQRLTHTIKALVSWSADYITDVGTTPNGSKLMKYNLQGVSEGTKMAAFMYYSAEFEPQMMELGRRLREGAASYTDVGRYASSLSGDIGGGTGITAKMLRKWQYNFIIDNGVGGDAIADFIQGRSIGTVGGRQYREKKKHADEGMLRVWDKFPSLED